ncbi:MAG: hypothetical protein ABI564_09860 [Ideonella sp.]
MNPVRMSSLAAMHLRRFAFGLLAAVCCLTMVSTAWAQDAAADAASRKQIALERRQANAWFEQRRLECNRRFAVTACVNDARATHRENTERLGREDEVLDSKLRHARAAERLEIIRQKTETLDRLSSVPVSPPAQPSAVHQADERRAIGRSASSGRSALELERKRVAADRAAAQRAAASQKRRDEAARQEAKRDAQRVKRKNPAGALPAFPPIPPSPPEPASAPRN